MHLISIYFLRGGTDSKLIRDYPSPKYWSTREYFGHFKT